MLGRWCVDTLKGVTEKSVALLHHDFSNPIIWSSHEEKH